jgi:hypothetical protein
MQNHIERDYCTKGTVRKGEGLVEIAHPENQQTLNSPLASPNPCRLEGGMTDFQPETATAQLLRYESQDAAWATPQIQHQA